MDETSFNEMLSNTESKISPRILQNMKFHVKQREPKKFCTRRRICVTNGRQTNLPQPLQCDAFPKVVRTVCWALLVEFFEQGRLKMFRKQVPLVRADQNASMKTFYKPHHFLKFSLLGVIISILVCCSRTAAFKNWCMQMCGMYGLMYWGSYMLVRDCTSVSTYGV